MPLLVLVLVLVALLVTTAVAYDLVARRRGRYRPRSHWEAVSSRRKSHFRSARDARRGGGTRPHDQR